MASGETLLKLSDFPFSYSLLAIIFSAMGSDFQGANLFVFISIAGSLGTFLTIIDPVGRILRYALQSGFKKAKTKTNEPEIHRKLDHVIKSLKTRSINIEIDKLVSLCYFGFILFLASSLVANYPHVAEHAQIKDANGNSICDTNCITHVGNVVLFLGTLAIGAVGTYNYREIKKYSKVAGIYHMSINLETVTRSTIDSMTKAMEVNDWETATEWSTRIQNEITERKGEQNKIEQLIDVIYKPLYDECLAVKSAQEQSVKTRSYSNLPNGIWRHIKTLPIYYRLDDPELAAEIDELYALKDRFNELIPISNNRILDIIKEESSKTYEKNTTSVNYFFNSKDGRSAPDLKSCLMFNIHPKDATENKSSKPDSIEVSYRSASNVGEYDKINSEEDFVKFDQLWSIMLDKVNSNDTIIEMKNLFEQIKKINEQLSKKLVQKFK